MPDLPEGLNAYWSVPQDELAARLNSSSEGLSSQEAEKCLARYGPNSLDIKKRATAFGLLLGQFTNPLVLILLFAVVVSIFAGEWTDAAVIIAIVFGSALISFAQEYSAGNAVAKLRERLTHYVKVRRDGREQSVPVETIVPGDIVLLSAGSLIPADAVVISQQDAFVNQAVLTGETFPVEKEVAPTPEHSTLAERTNCVFMGTSVRSGTASVLVVKTGSTTEYGGIADQLSLRVPETEFERGIRTFGLMLTRVMIILVIVVFAVNVLLNKPAIDSLLFAIALAVGISPELLPAIIAINLSKGARLMAKRGVIVRRLTAIENIGSMDVLCTDKTGTLTEGVVRLNDALTPEGEPSDHVFRLAYLNAHFQAGLANPLDEAITSTKTAEITGAQKAGEIPYDFDRKRLSVAVREAGKTLLVTKGALDNVLSVCDRYRDHGEAKEITPDRIADVQRRFEDWGQQGFRVLGVATRQLGDGEELSRESEENMTFEGFLLFFDPPKEDVKATLDALAELRVELKIITGDNRHVAAHVARSVGLHVRGTVTGAQLDSFTDEALFHAAETSTLFVEVDPNQKERIIHALRKRGHVVGYMGDGINDAPALHDADVGISVESAVDVAREAADFVLLRKGLDVLQHGILEGRRTFANSLKYVFTTESANFGNMLSMAGASMFLPFLPLLAKQILLNNFLSDVPAIAIAGDNVDPEYLRQPHRWDVKFIRTFMIVFGLVSSAFDFLTFGVLLYVMHAAEAEFQTGWFIESLLTELVVALIVRTRRPFYKSKPGKFLWITTLLTAIAALAVPYLPGSEVFGFVPLPISLMAVIVSITLAYALSAEVAKHIFYRRMSVA